MLFQVGVHLVERERFAADSAGFFGNRFLGGAFTPEANHRGILGQPFDPAAELEPRQPDPDVMKVISAVDKVGG